MGTSRSAGGTCVRCHYGSLGRSSEMYSAPNDALTGDAERFQAELRDRLAQFALNLHPDKTRLIQFGRRAAEERKRAGLGKPETFDFLGFTHICGRSRRGRFLGVERGLGSRKAEHGPLLMPGKRQA